MKSLIHAAAGSVALLSIASFWSATVISELFLSADAIVAIKKGILYGMLILIPAMAITGGSGFSLSRNRSGSLIDSKKTLMKRLAFNGMVVLVPAAFYLYAKALAGEFDAAFFAVQALELVVGAGQLLMMGQNFRDGLTLANRRRPRQACNRP